MACGIARKGSYNKPSTQTNRRSWLARIVAARSAVGEQIELTFFDAILHVAAGAVDLLIEQLRGGVLALSEVTTKRGLAVPAVHSALAMTRRWRLQLSRVDHWNSLNRRAGRPLALLSASAAASSAE